MRLPSRPARLAVVLLVWATGALAPRPAPAQLPTTTTTLPSGITFAVPGFSVGAQWSGASLGIPSDLGGILFPPSGNPLYVVGGAGSATSRLYAVGVVRNPVTKEITGLSSPASVVFSASVAQLDSGLDFGPAGTFFYAYFPANRLAERPGGVAGAEATYDMSPFMPLANDGATGLTFNPMRADPKTGFGRMLVGDGIARVREVLLRPDGGNRFAPESQALFVKTKVTIGGIGQLHFLPAPFQGDLMYADFGDGELRIIDVDPATGLPIDAGSGLPVLGTLNPKETLFASGFGSDALAGPFGLALDPLTNDLFVATQQGVPANTIVKIHGFSTVVTTTTTLATTSTSTSATSSTSSSSSTTTVTSTSSSTSSTGVGASTSTSTSTSTTKPSSTSTSVTTSSSTSTSRVSSSTTSTSTSTSHTSSTAGSGSTSTTLPGCGSVPRSGCIGSAAAGVLVRESIPGRERLKVLLRRLGPAVARTQLGDPVAGTTRYHLCLYDGAQELVAALTVDRAGATCGRAACWRVVGDRGYRYTDRAAGADGVWKLVAKGGAAGRGKVIVAAANDAARGETAMPLGITAALEGSTAVTAQLLTSDAGCFGATVPDVREADATSFRASGATAP